MRPEPEIRAAIATLERLTDAFPLSGRDLATISGEIAALRYVLNEEPTRPNLESLLEKTGALFAEMDEAEALTTTGVTS
jgi:hypothetical protein